MDKGYLFIATGEQYIREAITSVRSLRAINQDLHATLITDARIELEEFDDIIVQSVETGTGWKEGILFKVRGLQLSPYRRTFFVDTDTYFADDCCELFDLLDYFDLLIAHAPADTSQVIVEGHRLAGYYPYNTGVIVFNNNDSVKKLLADWLRAYREKFEYYPHDQAPFMEALLFNQVKVYVLQSAYNFRVPFLVTVPGLKVKIFHGRDLDFESFQKKINSTITHRTWKPRDRPVIYEDFKDV